MIKGRLTFSIVVEVDETGRDSVLVQMSNLSVAPEVAIMNMKAQLKRLEDQFYDDYNGRISSLHLK